MEAWLNVIQIFSLCPHNPVSISRLTSSKTKSWRLFSPCEATIIALTPLPFVSPSFCQLLFLRSCHSAAALVFYIKKDSGCFSCRGFSPSSVLLGRVSAGASTLRFRIDKRLQLQ